MRLEEWSSASEYAIACVCLNCLSLLGETSTARDTVLELPLRHKEWLRNLENQQRWT
jgi:hypothetical protein